MFPLSYLYLPMHETIFIKRPKFLAATSNLRVEQKVVHLGRFCIKPKSGWSDRNFLPYLGCFKFNPCSDLLFGKLWWICGDDACVLLKFC